MLDQILLRAVLRNEGRLEALRRARLLDTPPEEAFDHLTRLACRLLGVPVALVSFVEADRQVFKGSVDLPQSLISQREKSLLHAFCQRVVVTGTQLLVQDAGQHPILSDRLAIPDLDLDVMAFLGMPLTTTDGHTLGALCAVDTKPRTWTAGDVTALCDLAAVTMSEVTLHRLVLEMRECAAAEAVAHDALQARARRLEALRQLADGIAHDLAGVMQAVQSGVRLASARLGHDTATAQSFLALIGDAARRGGDLTARLLAFTPRGELRPKRVNVATLLQQVERVLANSSATPLRVHVNAEPNLPAVLADPEELKAVLLGLAAAARGAMPEGGTLTLGAALDEVAAGSEHPAQLRPSRYIRLFVTDTGTGLNGGKQAEAESPSSTAGSPSLDAQFELALVRDFAKQAGGGLIRESRPGAGSNVTLWMPVAGVSDLAAAGQEE